MNYGGVVRKRAVKRKLPKSGSVLIAKNGQPCAALVPAAEDIDLETPALSRSKGVGKLIADAVARGKKAGFFELAGRRGGAPHAGMNGG